MKCAIPMRLRRILMQINSIDFPPRIKKMLLSPGIVFVLFAILMFAIFNRVPLMPGDDLIFSEMHLQYNLADYLYLRYNTWSGRLFADGLNFFLAGEFTFLWKWLCTALLVASSFAIYKWVTLGKEMSPARKCLFACLCCFGLGLINSNILSSSVFWVTGALYYMVPVSMAVIVFTPFIFELKDKGYKTRAWLKAVCMLFAVFIAFTQEQVGVCLIAASAVIWVYLFIKTKKPNWFLVALTAVLLVFVLVSLNAPGNALRYEANNGTFPLFNLLDFKQRFAIMSHFTMNTLINQSYMPLMFLWFVTGWALFQKKDRKAMKVLGAASIAIAAVMLARQIIPVDSNIFGPYIEHFNRLFSFNYYLDMKSNYVPEQMGSYIFWGISLLLIPVNIWFIWGRSQRSFLYTLIFAAGISAIILITFTPLLYFSGARTGYLPNTLFLILLYFMLAHFEKLKKLVILIICIGLIKLVLLWTLWNATGFKLWYGVLDTNSIPFKVTNS